MQSGNADSEVFLQRLRSAVQKGNAVLGNTPQHGESPLDVIAPVTSAPLPVPVSEVSSSPAVHQGEKPRIKHALVALERAALKNAAARRWPRFLRDIRRDQGAVNESLLRAARALTETIEWLRQKFAILDARSGDLSARSQEHDRHLVQLQEQFVVRARQIGENEARVEQQAQRLAEFDGRLEQQMRRAMDEEQLSALRLRRLAELEQRIDQRGHEAATQDAQIAEHHRRIAEQEKQYLDLSYKLLALQTQVSSYFERAVTQQLSEETRLKNIERLMREDSRLLGDQQSQLAELQDALRQSSQSEAQITKRLLQVDEMLKEMQAIAEGHLKHEAAENEREELYRRAVEAIGEVKRQLAEVRSDVETWKRGLVTDADVLDEVESLRDKVTAVQASFAIIQQYLSRASSTKVIKTIAPSLNDELKRHETDAFYLAFENRFRGDREDIKRRLSFYIPVIEETKGITKKAVAVDVGCGRGEWLELLHEHGYSGLGIDANICMVEECRSRGLDAECRDAIAYLRSVRAGSVSLITGFHIVEHLSFTQLLDLFTESFRVLRRCGAVIFETPNPECAKVLAYSFYLDPTHRNPIPQELLCFVGRQAGFGSVSVERLQPYYEEGIVKGFWDYGAIFRK